MSDKSEWKDPTDPDNSDDAESDEHEELENDAAPVFFEEEDEPLPDVQDANQNVVFVDTATLKPFQGTSLTYDLSELTWDGPHRTNKQNKYCYCGQPKSQWSSMVKCSGCRNWFHVECFKRKQPLLPLPGDRFYQFTCCICNAGESEALKLQDRSWTEITRIAIYNLTLLEKRKNLDNPRKFFRFRDDICTFLDDNWDSLCYGKTRTKTWMNTIAGALSQRSQYFKRGIAIWGKAGEGLWALGSDVDPSTFSKKGLPAPKTKKKSSEKKKILTEAELDELGDMDADIFDDPSYRPAKKKRRDFLNGTPQTTNTPSNNIMPVFTFPKPAPLPPVPVMLIKADTIRLDYNTPYANLNVFPDLRVDAAFMAVACPELLQSIKQNNVSSFPKLGLKLLIDVLYEKPIQKISPKGVMELLQLAQRLKLNNVVSTGSEYLVRLIRREKKGHDNKFLLHLLKYADHLNLETAVNTCLQEALNFSFSDIDLDEAQLPRKLERQLVAKTGSAMNASPSKGSGAWKFDDTEMIDVTGPEPKSNMYSLLTTLLESELESDFILKVENIHFKVHKFVLAARSVYFKHLFERKQVIKEVSFAIPSEHTMGAPTTTLLLHLFYAGQVSSTQINADTCLEIMQLPHSFCKNHPHLLVQNEPCLAKLLDFCTPQHLVRMLTPQSCLKAIKLTLNNGTRDLTPLAQYAGDHYCEIFQKVDLDELMTAPNGMALISRIHHFALLRAHSLFQH